VVESFQVPFVYRCSPLFTVGVVHRWYIEMHLQVQEGRPFTARWHPRSDRGSSAVGAAAWWCGHPRVSCCTDHWVSVSGWSEHHGAGLRGVAEMLSEYRVDVGIRRMAPGMRWVTAARARDGTAAGALASTEPEGLAELLEEGVQFGFGAVGPHPVVGRLGAIDLRLELADVGFVGAASLVVEDRAGGTAHVDAAHQLECGQFTSVAGRSTARSSIRGLARPFRHRSNPPTSCSLDPDCRRCDASTASPL
jgi:hypothetical protein